MLIFFLSVFFLANLELRSQLTSFVDEETKQYYDDYAELAVNTMLSNDLEMKELVNAWTKSFTEVSAFLIWVFFFTTVHLCTKNCILVQEKYKKNKNDFCTF